MISAQTPRQRPLLRYFGGKARLAPSIVRFLPRHDKYVEPFCGGASVLLAKPRARCEVIGDLDSRLINLFRVLQNGRARGELLDALRYTPYARAEHELAMQPASGADAVEEARRYLIRSWMSFATDGLNRPTGFRDYARPGRHPATDWANWKRALPALCERLDGVLVESRDGVHLMQDHDGAGVVFYVDPPYLGSTRGTNGGYTHDMRSGAEHEALLTLRGFVVLSGYRSELYDDLLGDWARRDFRARAGTNSLQAEGHRTECLWLSPGTVEALGHTPSMFDATAEAAP